MVEHNELMAKAAAWMQARGRKMRIAAKRRYGKSLFEHRLIEATPT